MNEERQRFDRYVERINGILQSEDFYAKFTKKLRAAKPLIKLNTKTRAKVFDVDWVDKIEDCLPNLDNIVRNPRKFIVQEEDIVDISLARAISTESVKHLAQHTNLIASVDKEGNVTPNKILNVTKEESFEIYENRFIYTLLKNLHNFVNRRMDAIKASYVNDHVLELNVDTTMFTGKTRIFYKLDLIGTLPVEEVKEMKNDDLTIVERIAKMQRIIQDFLGSPFAKQMVNSAPVRPPITRTNVILKNPDFKKALVLWQFVESYNKMGFAVENQLKPVGIDNTVGSGISDMIYLGAMLMEGLVEGSVNDEGYFDESRMDEKDLEENKGEGEKPAEEEKAEEGEKETEKPVETPDSQTVPEETPQKSEEEESEDEGEKDKREDEDLEVEVGLSEARNMFQRTSDDNNLSKAEISRINKAIDRVLLQLRAVKAESAGEQALENMGEDRSDRLKALKKLEKEISKVRNSINQRRIIAERERSVFERAIKRETETLESLEKKLAAERRLLEDESGDLEGELARLGEGLAAETASIEAMTEIAADGAAARRDDSADDRARTEQQEADSVAEENNAAAAEREDAADRPGRQEAGDAAAEEVNASAEFEDAADRPEGPKESAAAEVTPAAAEDDGQAE